MFCRVCGADCGHACGANRANEETPASMAYNLARFISRTERNPNEPRRNRQHNLPHRCLPATFRFADFVFTDRLVPLRKDRALRVCKSYVLTGPACEHRSLGAPVEK